MNSEIIVFDKVSLKISNTKILNKNSVIDLLMNLSLIKDELKS